MRASKIVAYINEKSRPLTSLTNLSSGILYFAHQRFSVVRQCFLISGLHDFDTNTVSVALTSAFLWFKGPSKISWQYCLKLLNAVGRSGPFQSIWGSWIRESSPILVNKVSASRTVKAFRCTLRRVDYSESSYVGFILLLQTSNSHWAYLTIPTIQSIAEEIASMLGKLRTRLYSCKHVHLQDGGN